MTDDHSTYLAHAKANADLEAGGRFKKEMETKVTGVPRYPQQPESSPWRRDPVPPERPIDGRSEGDRLGFAIDGGAPRRE